MELMRYKPDTVHNLQEEYNNLTFCLRFIVSAWAAAMQVKFCYTPTVTEVNRTQGEQDFIYTYVVDADTQSRYKVKPWGSVHQYRRGIDFRAYDMTPEMIEFSKDFFNHITYDIDRGVKTLVYHDVGCGIHFHVQTNSVGMTCIRNRPL